MGADLVWWDLGSGVRVVGALAVLVLCARHEEVAATGAGDGLHADLERDRVDVGLALVCKDDGAADCAAQPTEATARTDEPLQLLEVVVLVKEPKPSTKRDIGWTRSLQAIPVL